MPLQLSWLRTLRRQTALALRPLFAARVSASRCRVVVDSALLVVLTISIWDSVEPMAGKYLINSFQYQEVVGCMHAELLVQQQ